MKHRKLIGIGAVIGIIIALAMFLTSCAPKDALSLVKEAERATANAAELTITDTVNLQSLSLYLYNTDIGTVTLSLNGGNTYLKRKIDGKSVDIEFSATGINMRISPSIAGMAINASGFKDVKILFRLRLRDNELTYYALIEGLDKLSADLKDKIEYKSSEALIINNAAAESLRLLARQPITGNYSSNGDYDKNKSTYAYTLEDNEKINNELTRLIKMFIDMNIDKLSAITKQLENIFGTKDVESIANEILTYSGYKVDCTVKNGKYGYYFDTVTTAINSSAKIDSIRTGRIIGLTGLDKYLGDGGITSRITSSVKILSEIEFKA